MKKFVWASLLYLAACSPQSSQKAGPIEKSIVQTSPSFHADVNPQALSAWGQLSFDEGVFKPNSDVVVYDLNTPLFSDYALKLRTLWLPEGTTARYRENDVLNFPIGTVITKTFYYPKGKNAAHVLKPSVEHYGQQRIDLAEMQLIETRILARRTDGWVALPYVWNEAQTDATLQRTGDLKPLTLVTATQNHDFIYTVPNQNQCAGCHATNNTTREIKPIGPKPRHLNRSLTYTEGIENQLNHLQKIGYLEGLPTQPWPQNAVWNDDSPSLGDPVSLNARARAYLDINCAHCHNPVGPADTSGLHLQASAPHGPNLGICKLPIAAGAGTGNRRHDIAPGAPEDSIFIYRMASTEPDKMMPELGRSLAHEEGITLISDWIANMDQECG